VACKLKQLTSHLPQNETKQNPTLPENLLLNHPPLNFSEVSQLTTERIEHPRQNLIIQFPSTTFVLTDRHWQYNNERKAATFPARVLYLRRQAPIFCYHQENFIVSGIPFEL
jgi:hypothetical protein